MNSSPPFHLALPVLNLGDARQFYCGVLGCSEGRSAPRWIDFNFFGHQLSVHLHPDALAGDHTNAVDGDNVPVRHFGVVLPWSTWEALVERLTVSATDFQIAPRVRFAGKSGEQGTFFITDPSGNALEFKSFRDINQLFAK